LQHSFVVAELVPDRLKFHALVHDMTECHSNDICTNWKTDEFRAMEHEALAQMYWQQNARLPNKDEEAAVKAADIRARAGEVHTVGDETLRDLFPIDNGAACLTRHYYKMFQVPELVSADGAAPRLFLDRYFKYRDMMN
jgi:5'-deoxynucleotidase YfbR-like HD superfamily hydrolase